MCNAWVKTRKQYQIEVIIKVYFHHLNHSVNPNLMARSQGGCRQLTTRANYELSETHRNDVNNKYGVKTPAVDGEINT